MKLNELVVEVTRRCQLECPHCLRGPAEPTYLSFSYIIELLQDVESIRTVTFTGGEPFLFPSFIQYFSDYCKDHDIEIDYFYIATNGIIFDSDTKFARDCLMAIISLYAICNEKEMCAIKVSKDKFHYTDNSAGELLKGFSFVEFDESLGGIILSGNALDQVDPNSHSMVEEKENKIPVDFYESTVYISSKGKIVWNCDLSYERIDEEGISIKEAKKILKNLRENEYED